MTQLGLGCVPDPVLLPGERDRLDRYYTPDALAHQLVALLPLYGAHRVLEPSAGGGAFVRAALALTPHVHALDLDENAPVLRSPPAGADCRHGDFLATSAADWPPLDAIVGNPPYGRAEEHVLHALDLVPERGTVAFLLRLAFLEGAGRVAFWREHPCFRVWVLAQRPSFTGGGTDSAAYAWFVWCKGWRGLARLEVLSWR